MVSPAVIAQRKKSAANARKTKHEKEKKMASQAKLDGLMDLLFYDTQDDHPVKAPLKSSELPSLTTKDSPTLSSIPDPELADLTLIDDELDSARRKKKQAESYAYCESNMDKSILKLIKERVKDIPAGTGMIKRLQDWDFKTMYEVSELQAIRMTKINMDIINVEKELRDAGVKFDEKGNSLNLEEKKEEEGKKGKEKLGLKKKHKCAQHAKEDEEEATGTGLQTVTVDLGSPKKKEPTPEKEPGIEIEVLNQDSSDKPTVAAVDPEKTPGFMPPPGLTRQTGIVTVESVKVQLGMNAVPELEHNLPTAEVDAGGDVTLVAGDDEPMVEKDAVETAAEDAEADDDATEAEDVTVEVQEGGEAIVAKDASTTVRRQKAPGSREKQKQKGNKQNKSKGKPAQSADKTEESPRTAPRSKDQVARPSGKQEVPPAKKEDDDEDDKAMTLTHLNIETGEVTVQQVLLSKDGEGDDEAFHAPCGCTYDLPTFSPHEAVKRLKNLRDDFKAICSDKVIVNRFFRNWQIFKRFREAMPEERDEEVENLLRRLVRFMKAHLDEYRRSKQIHPGVKYTQWDKWFVEELELKKKLDPLLTIVGNVGGTGGIELSPFSLRVLGDFGIGWVEKLVGGEVADIFRECATSESSSARERALSLLRKLSPAIALICPDPYPCQWRAEQPRFGELYGALDKACRLNLNGMSLYRLVRGVEPVATSLKGKTDLTILRQNLERVRSTKGTPAVLENAVELDEAETGGESVHRFPMSVSVFKPSAPKSKLGYCVTEEIDFYCISHPPERFERFAWDLQMLRQMLDNFSKLLLFRHINHPADLQDSALILDQTERLKYHLRDNGYDPETQTQPESYPSYQKLERKREGESRVQKAKSNQSRIAILDCEEAAIVGAGWVPKVWTDNLLKALQEWAMGDHKETNSRSRLSNLIYDVGPLAHWSLLEDHQNEFHLLSLLCEHLYGRTAQEIADAGPSQVKKADSARKKRQKSSHKCAAKSAVIEEGSDALGLEPVVATVEIAGVSTTHQTGAKGEGASISEPPTTPSTIVNPPALPSTGAKAQSPKRKSQHPAFNPNLADYSPDSDDETISEADKHVSEDAFGFPGIGRKKLDDGLYDEITVNNRWMRLFENKKEVEE